MLLAHRGPSKVHNVVECQGAACTKFYSSLTVFFYKVSLTCKQVLVMPVLPESAQIILGSILVGSGPGFNH